MRKLRNAFVGVAIAALLPGVAEAQSRRVTIVNHSGQSLYNFYASNTATNTWPDLMGEDDIIGDGEEKTIDLDDGTNACRFDLRAVFKNGRTVTAKAVDVCKLSKWVFDGYGHNELVYDNFKPGTAATQARPAQRSEAPPAPRIVPMKVYTCILKGERAVLEIPRDAAVTSADSVKLTINGRPVHLVSAEDKTDLWEGARLEMQSDDAFYQFNDSTSAEEKPSLERKLPGWFKDPSKWVVGGCTVR